MTAISFSADLGGQDAADVVLPHFKALKKAAEGVELADFPFPKLAYILRVSGTVTAFGPRGAENLDLDRRKQYLSVDIILTESDRSSPQALIVAAMSQSVDLIRTTLRQRRINWNEAALKVAIDEVGRRYLEIMSARPNSQ